MGLRKILTDKEPALHKVCKPVTSFDWRLHKLLEDMKDIIKTAVIATHDMQLVCQWAERIIVLSGGKVVADGSRDEIFSQTRLTQLVGIRPPEIFTMAQALNPQALCYTIDAFTQAFQEAKSCVR